MLNPRISLHAFCWPRPGRTFAKLPCLGISVKFQLVYLTTSKRGSQLTSTSPNALRGRGSEKGLRKLM